MTDIKKQEKLFKSILALKNLELKRSKIKLDDQHPLKRKLIAFKSTSEARFFKKRAIII